MFVLKIIIYYKDNQISKMFFSSFNQTSQNVENEFESESEEEIDYDAEFKDFLNTLNLVYFLVI